MDPPHISSRVAGCGKAFDRLKNLLQGSPHFSVKVPPEAIGDEFDRFKLWAGNIAAHRKGRRSLEYRLRDAAHLKTEAHNLLTELQAFLGDACAIVCGERTPWDEVQLSDSDSDSDSEDDASTTEGNLQGNTELEQILAGIKNAVTCLFRLSMAIRDPAPNSQSRKIMTIDRSYFEVYDIDHVKSKFPSAQDFLIDRLGRAVSARRQYLSYREEHHKKLAKNIEKIGFEEPRTEYTTNSTEASALPQNEASNSQADAAIDIDDTLSQTSYAPSVDTPIRVPSLPKEGRDQKPFECPLCFMIVSIHTTAAWKQHVYRDLHPYACTFEHCITADRLYDSRHAWFKHEKEAHRTVWQCIEGCGKTFDSDAALSSHVKKSHPEIAAFDSALKRTAAQTSSLAQQTECCLCGKILSLRALEKHLGNHQEQLALFALPANLDATEDEPEEANSDQLASDISEDESLDEDEAPSVNIFRRYSPLLDASEIDGGLADQYNSTFPKLVPLPTLLRSLSESRSSFYECFPLLDHREASKLLFWLMSRGLLNNGSDESTEPSRDLAEEQATENLDRELSNVPVIPAPDESLPLDTSIYKRSNPDAGPLHTSSSSGDMSHSLQGADQNEAQPHREHVRTGDHEDIQTSHPLKDLDPTPPSQPQHALDAKEDHEKEDGLFPQMLEGLEAEPSEEEDIQTRVSRIKERIEELTSSAGTPEGQSAMQESKDPSDSPSKGKEIPQGARWTTIDRRLVNHQALEEAGMTFEEETPDRVKVFKVLKKDEIQELANRTKEIREQRVDKEEVQRGEGETQTSADVNLSEERIPNEKAHSTVSTDNQGDVAVSHGLPTIAETSTVDEWSEDEWYEPGAGLRFRRNNPVTINYSSGLHRTRSEGHAATPNVTIYNTDRMGTEGFSDKYEPSSSIGQHRTRSQGHAPSPNIHIYNTDRVERARSQGHTPQPNVSIYNTDRLDSEGNPRGRSEYERRPYGQSSTNASEWSLDDEIAELRREIRMGRGDLDRPPSDFNRLESLTEAEHRKEAEERELLRHKIALMFEKDKAKREELEQRVQRETIARKKREEEDVKLRQLLRAGELALKESKEKEKMNKDQEDRHEELTLQAEIENSSRKQNSIQEEGNSKTGNQEEYYEEKLRQERQKLKEQNEDELAKLKKQVLAQKDEQLKREAPEAARLAERSEAEARAEEEAEKAESREYERFLQKQKAAEEEAAAKKINEEAELEAKMRERLAEFGFQENQIQEMLKTEAGTKTMKQDFNLEDQMRGRFADFGFQQNQVQALMNPEERRTQPQQETTPQNLPLDPNRPTYPKIHKDHLDVETLIYYDIPYEFDVDDPNYFIVLRELDSRESDILFEHTRRLRSRSNQSDRLIIERPSRGHEYAWVRRRKRASSPRRRRNAGPPPISLSIFGDVVSSPQQPADLPENAQDESLADNPDGDIPH